MRSVWEWFEVYAVTLRPPHGGGLCPILPDHKHMLALDTLRSLPGMAAAPTWPLHCADVRSRSERVKGGWKVPLGSAEAAGRR